MRVLVTGGAGFIGSHLVVALLRRGDDVRVLDNFSTGFRSNLAAVDGEFELLEGDLRSYERVHAAVRGCDAVLHQGALPSVPRSVQDPLTSSEINIGGTLNVLLTARDESVRRVVVASSSSVYGDTPGLPRVETMAASPIAPYAVAKLAAEQYAVSFNRVYGLQTVALRYFNVFGPRQDPSSQYSAVIPKFIVALQQGQAPEIYGDGEQSRDFTFIDDVVQANLLAIDAPDAAGRAFNVACGQQRSLNELMRALNRLLGTDIDAVHAPPRTGDVVHSLADISLARRLLGYEPGVDFEDGLERTAHEYSAAPI
ncbi:MAG TPA: SDR family oxidoreductase [Solirubrobacteraceae bacterium]|nr:SDR family oxidoreductase [Solirubrobacteraceae bacterium]